jgi:hypothetical protein
MPPLKPKRGSKPPEQATRFEVTLHPGKKRLAVDDVADLDLDRVPDAKGAVRVLVTHDEIADLEKRGFEVRVVSEHPVRPLDPALVMSDRDAAAWLKEQTKSIRRRKGS